MVGRKRGAPADIIAQEPPKRKIWGSLMKKLIATFAAVVAAGPALAHHPLAGQPMETFAHGILSGVGRQTVEVQFDELHLMVCARSLTKVVI